MYCLLLQQLEKECQAIMSRLFIIDTTELLNGRTWAQHCQSGCLAWQREENRMPQGCPNLCYWHYPLGRAHYLELAERH